MYLHKVIATEKKAKDGADSAVTEALAQFGKPNLYTGLSRVYTPLNDEDNERLPSESQHVQVTVQSIIDNVQEKLVALFDKIATKDYANCSARADIVVDGEPLLKNVPATYLLFLEKQIAGLLAFAKKIPTLDMSEKWDHDPARDTYATKPVKTMRTKKKHSPFVLYEATKEHPAQVQVLAEDITAGTWETTKFSAALPTKQVNEMIARIEKLQEAIVHAREEANRSAAPEQVVGITLLHYVFGTSTMARGIQSKSE